MLNLALCELLGKAKNQLLTGIALFLLLLHYHHLEQGIFQIQQPLVCQLVCNFQDQIFQEFDLNTRLELNKFIFEDDLLLYEHQESS